MMPTAPLDVRLRQVGWLPWVLLGPSLFLLAIMVWAAVADRIFVWPEARSVVAEQKPVAAVCISLESERVLTEGETTSGHRRRSYLILRSGGPLTCVIVRQTLPDGPIESMESQSSVLFPLGAIIVVSCGALLMRRRLRQSSKAPAEREAPPISFGVTPPAVAGRSAASSARASTLYNVGYAVAWLSLACWVGFFVFIVASLSQPGTVPDVDSWGVILYSIVWAVVPGACWITSIVSWVYLFNRRRSTILAIVLLATCLAPVSFLYLFAALPRLRRDLPPSRPAGPKAAG
jgi:hypothetical protein